MKCLTLLVVALLAYEVASQGNTGGGAGLGGGAGGLSQGGGGDALLRAEKISDAALATHEAILKANDRASIRKAVQKGHMMATAAADNTISHSSEHAMDKGEKGGRHLLAGPAIAGGAQGAELRSEKISDAALGTHEAILKASLGGRGSIPRATAVGSMMMTAAHDPTVSHASEHAMEKKGPRKLLSEGRGSEEMGTMDGSQAISASILKAVNVPNKGGIKYATARGAEVTQIVATRPQNRFNVHHGLD